MSAYAHHERVKLTVECSEDERSYIKMLAAKKRMTISEYILSFVRPKMPHEPNEETKRAMRDVDLGKTLGPAKTVKEFWAEMGIDPNA